MPRRTRVQPHTFRKRAEAPSPARLRTAHQRAAALQAEELPSDVAEEQQPVTDEVRPAAVPYIRRRPPATPPVDASGTRPAASTRAERLAVTDYGYVVSELKRIGLTGGGILILLLILSRIIH